ncbi:hypothetical protein CYMTET_6836 [Cymbomonas tetramitiformis]|uniref:Secreted protein n=1 Tax=Cymbomonas tetramitiformis TaxID=36881 RepID=A0AAE0GWS6_9CHLO|nr:hypothetical protein CYMTET_6836 [Cymbomonas tetramitiformis]
MNVSQATIIVLVLRVANSVLDELTFSPSCLLIVKRLRKPFLYLTSHVSSLVYQASPSYPSDNKHISALCRPAATRPAAAGVARSTSVVVGKEEQWLTTKI